MVDGKLTFLLNPGGPALVEPSVLNPSDPNHGVDFGFAEFTLNDAQLYANISFVDFAPRIPIALTLHQQSGATQNVAGMPPDGLDRLADALRAQTQKDGRPWDKLIVQDPSGRTLRVLNATHGGAVSADFAGYFEPLVDEAWDKYAKCKCAVDTQAGPGVLEGHITSSGKLRIGDEEFEKPNTADILGCNSGPFTTGASPARNAIIPRLAAAFVRSSIVDAETHPSSPDTFYKREITNHYARAVHEVSKDGKGYAFAYDDVQENGGEDQSGKVEAGDPRVWVVSVGGKSGKAPQDRPQQKPQQPQPNEQQDQQQPPADAPAAEKQGFRDRLFAQAKGKAKGFLSR